MDVVVLEERWSSATVAVPGSSSGACSIASPTVRPASPPGRRRRAVWRRRGPNPWGQSDGRGVTPHAGSGRGGSHGRRPSRRLQRTAQSGPDPNRGAAAVRTRPGVRRRLVVRGVVQGVGFRPYVYAPRLLPPSGRGGLEQRRRRRDRGGGAGSRGRQVHRPAAGRPAAAGPADDVAVRGRVPVGGTGFTIPTVRAGRAGAPSSRPTSRPATTACAELRRPRRPSLPLPVHHLHQLRPALHDHRPTCPTTGPATTMAGFPLCARLRRRSTPTRPTAASTPRPIACPDCGPRLRPGRRPAAPDAGRGEDALAAAARPARGGARSSRSRASAATTWPATRADRAAVRAAARAQATRATSRSRSWSRDLAAAARTRASVDDAEARAARPRRRAPDRAAAGAAPAIAASRAAASPRASPTSA